MQTEIMQTQITQTQIMLTEITSIKILDIIAQLQMKIEIETEITTMEKEVIGEIEAEEEQILGIEAIFRVDGEHALGDPMTILIILIILILIILTREIILIGL
jgi:hypothetical protein